jgi:hypothetical protein
MRLALRTVTNATVRKAAHTEKVSRQREELAGVALELREHYYIAVPEVLNRPGGEPRVTGRFDAGVRILAEPFLVDDPAPPKGSAVHTPATGDTVKSYIRQEGLIVEAAP